MSPDDAWLDQLAEGIVRIHGGRVVRLNAAAATLLGADPRRSIGRPAIAVLRDHRLERVWLDGGARELTLRGRRIEAARIDGGLALRDVTDARTARDEARELLAVLSHELRTPVTTVRSTLEALAYDDLPGDMRADLMARATAEAERLGRLLEDLTVDVAPPRERSVRVAPLIERARDVLAPILDEHGVTVRVDADDAVAWADPDKVLQVVLNLVENAAIHGPDGAEVEVWARTEGDVATLRVRDRGVPLADARLEALFALRARAAGAKARGTGLGLWIVRSIAERAGGQACGRPWRDGAASRGNEFLVRLPARRGVRVRSDPTRA